ncbi:MAG: hypothetical protein ACNI3A_18265 [Desulfovibrio sp.]|uniref:hypothetical protein n=1 Tax=Desulfovibrio sp. 7SRBS1 TaxID=3378064 RepID=UPI003B40B272
MRTFSLLTILAAILFLSAPAQAKYFCDDYGVSCYKQVPNDKETCPFLEIGNPDGKYIGSVHLPEGMCWDVPFSCVPCDKGVDQEKLSDECNKQFAECDGKCVAE